jgi:glutamine amidotransferase
VPHMGWNEISVRQGHKVITPLDGEDVYFVHGYGAAMAAAAQGDIAATTDYGGPVIAALARDNMIGVQFHPEKSQAAGLGLIERFLEWRP